MIILMAIVITMILMAMMTMLDAGHDAGYDDLCYGDAGGYDDYDAMMVTMMITNAICDDNGYDD